MEEEIDLRARCDREKLFSKFSSRRRVFQFCQVALLLLYPLFYNRNRSAAPIIPFSISQIYLMFAGVPKERELRITAVGSN
jgi:hypothetical protein